MKYLIIIVLFSSCKVYIPENGKYLLTTQVFKRVMTKPYHNWSSPYKP